MTTITTRDGTQIYFKDWGPKDAQPIVFHHGWPLSGDDWDTQMLFFLKRGYRVIAHDRRGHGRSTQTADGHDMDTYAADLAAVVDALGLQGAIHVGHSTGGGEATRYVARYGKGRAAMLVLIGAVPPLLVKTASNPGGTPIEVFDGLSAQLAANRTAFYWDFILPFYGYNREGAVVNEAVRLNWWRQAMMGGAYPELAGVKAFSETDFTEDLKSIDIPVVFMHGEDDQIVPIADSALLGVKLVKHGTLKTYPGLPHGMATTHAETINADLLGFIQAQGLTAARAASERAVTQDFNVVLVHGGFVDGAGWKGVYERLRQDGFKVDIVQNPTTSLAEDVAATKLVLDGQDKPVILVGHSYGGVVISEAGNHPNVARLVYIAAFAPDKGESVAKLIANPPPGSPVPPILPPQDGFLFLDKAKFQESFAADVDDDEAAFMADSQTPWGVGALSGEVTEPAWASKPSFYLVATEDRMIPPDAQRSMSKRAGSTVVEERGSHAIYVSQPKAVAQLIADAAGSPA